MSELYSLVETSQIGNSESMEQLCEKFSPLVKKYAYKLSYEDAYNDLQVYFIEGILQIPLNSGKFILADNYILSYINKIVYHAYIILSKKLQQQNCKNVSFENYEYVLETITYRNNLSKWQDELFKLDIKEILNDREFDICILKFVWQYTDKEIAEQYNVSRQAITKIVGKIKKKLKNYYSD